MASESELLRLSLLAYEASLEPALWDTLLEGYAKAVSADFTVLQVHDPDLHKSIVLNGFGLSSPFTKSYNEHYSKLNIWRDQGRALLVPGRVNLSEELCPRSVFERSAFFNEYMRHVGSYGIGAVISREQTGLLNLTAQRRKGAFSEREREIAKFLLPHLKRAWDAHRHLEILLAGEAILQSLPLGIVLISMRGVAVYCNDRAEDIFRSGDGLTLSRGILCAADRLSDARLQRVINHALSPKHPLGPAAVEVPRLSLRRSYLVVAAPLRGRLRRFSDIGAPHAVLFIRDPERQEPARADLLVQLYGLTPKEAAIAVRLAEGKSVERAAREMQMRYETARTHLRHIFSKTGTSRQAELLLLIARLPAIPTCGPDEPQSGPFP